MESEASSPKLRLLRDLPLFASCSRGELKRIAALSAEAEFPAGYDLITEGSPASDFFVIAEGSAEVRRGEEIIRAVGPGDFFGEISLVADVPRTATVTATTPLRVLVLTANAFEILFREQPHLGEKVQSGLVARLADDARRNDPA